MSSLELRTIDDGFPDFIRSLSLKLTSDFCRGIALEFVKLVPVMSIDRLPKSVSRD